MARPRCVRQSPPYSGATCGTGGRPRGRGRSVRGTATVPDHAGPAADRLRAGSPARRRTRARACSAARSSGIAKDRLGIVIVHPSAAQENPEGRGPDEAFHWSSPLYAGCRVWRRWVRPMPPEQMLGALRSSDTGYRVRPGPTGTSLGTSAGVGCRAGLMSLGSSGAEPSPTPAPCACGSWPAPAARAGA